MKPACGQPLAAVEVSTAAPFCTFTSPQTVLNPSRFGWVEKL